MQKDLATKVSTKAHKEAMQTKLDKTCKPKDKECAAGVTLATFNTFKKADFSKLKTQTDGYKSRLGQLDTSLAKSFVDLATISATLEQMRNETSTRISSLINENKELRGKIEQLQQRMNGTIN